MKIFFVQQCRMIDIKGGPDPTLSIESLNNYLEIFSIELSTRFSMIDVQLCLQKKLDLQMNGSQRLRFIQQQALKVHAIYSSCEPSIAARPIRIKQPAISYTCTASCDSPRIQICVCSWQLAAAVHLKQQLNLLVNDRHNDPSSTQPHRCVAFRSCKPRSSYRPIHVHCTNIVASSCNASLSQLCVCICAWQLAAAVHLVTARPLDE